MMIIRAIHRGGRIDAAALPMELTTLLQSFTDHAAAAATRNGSEHSGAARRAAHR
jgi:hypothetical protein